MDDLSLHDSFKAIVHFLSNQSGLPYLVQLLTCYMCQITLNFGILEDDQTIVLATITSSKIGSFCQKWSISFFFGGGGGEKT